MFLSKCCRNGTFISTYGGLLFLGEKPKANYVTINLAIIILRLVKLAAILRGRPFKFLCHLYISLVATVSL